MQNINNIIKTAALAIIAAVLATGCINEKYSMQRNLQSVMIQLDVSPGSEMTKITEAPTDQEQAINTLRVYAFNGNRMCGYYHLTNTYTGPVIMDLELPDGTSVVDFYLIANEAAMHLTDDTPALNENTTLEQLRNIRFTSLNSSGGMPMYCVQTESIDVSKVAGANTADGHKGHIVLDHHVKAELSRPVAKLAVYAAKTDANAPDIRIKDVKMLAKGTRQYNYLLEQDPALLEAIPSRLNDRDLLVPESVMVTSSYTDRNDVSQYDPVGTPVYLSEVTEGSSGWDVNAGDEVRSVVLHIEYSEGAGTEVRHGYVNMPPIERNSFYKILCGFNSEGRINVTYIVAEWEEAQMWQGGLVFDHPTHSYLMPSYSSSSRPETEAVMKYAVDGSGAFKAYFQMQYPDHQTWDPTLLDGNPGDYTVEVWDYLETQQITDPDQFVSSADKWYLIKVIPKNAENAGNSVRLAITYTPHWSVNAVEFLMINGSQNSLFWEYSGTAFEQDPNYVIITQQ